jgi:protoheme IX farnesyltransferase
MGRIVEMVNAPRAAIGPFGAYVSLAKPKAIPAHFLTAAAAMFLAAGGTPPVSTLLLTLLGGGCTAAAANALNCVLDRDIDALMTRTRGRPLPSGLVKPDHALAFAGFFGLAGVSILGGFVNRAAAILALTALAYYVLAYTLLLRRRTRWSAIVGSAIGAIPPVIGWVVVTDRIGPTPFLLGAIIILWTVPHFWALAFFRRDDYARAGLRTLPEKGVGVWITACSSALVAISLILVRAASLGPVYVTTACLSGAGLLYLSARMNHREPLRAARHLYSYSIVYLAVLFGAMIVDRIAGKL